MRPRRAKSLTGTCVSHPDGKPRAACRARCLPAGRPLSPCVADLAGTPQPGRGDCTLRLREAPGASPTWGPAPFEAAPWGPGRRPWRMVGKGQTDVWRRRTGIRRGLEAWPVGAEPEGPPAPGAPALGSQARLLFQTLHGSLTEPHYSHPFANNSEDFFSNPFLNAG